MGQARLLSVLQKLSCLTGRHLTIMLRYELLWSLHIMGCTTGIFYTQHFGDSRLGSMQHRLVPRCIWEGNSTLCLTNAIILPLFIVSELIKEFCLERESSAVPSKVQVCEGRCGQT